MAPPLVPVTAAPGAPFTSINCPDDKGDVAAADIRRVAAALLGNDAHYESLKVNRAGDTMTGKLIVAPSGTGGAIEATGGSSDGLAIKATGGATNGDAINAFGTGSGYGIKATGGASAPAVLAQGGTNQPGIVATGDGTAEDIRCTGNKGIKFTGTEPATGDTPTQNAVYALSGAKVIATITTDGAGNATVSSGGLNVASASAASTVLTITPARSFASSAYTVEVSDATTPTSATARVFGWNKSTSNGGSIKLFGREITAGAVANIDFATQAVVVCVTAFGLQ